jgi:hypothetical protein
MAPDRRWFRTDRISPKASAFLSSPAQGEEAMSNGKSVTRTRASRKAAAEPDLGFDWGLANSLLLGLGVGVVAVGYLALSKGSITLAPVLLVLGYVVLIPASLLLRRRRQGSGE